MITSILLCIVFLVLILNIISYVKFRPENFPPGPPRLPLFGSYLFMLVLDYKYLHKAALKLSSFYKSKIIGVYIGEVPTIIANSKEGVMEILKRSEFDGRPDIFAARLRDPNFNRKGIFFTEGPMWREQRRFVLRYLRDFGFGRRFEDLEHNLNNEITEMIDLFRNGPKFEHEKKYVKNGAILLPNALSACMGNCFLQVLCNERRSRSDQHILFDMGKAALSFQRNGDDYGLLLSIIPWIRHIFPSLSHYKQLRETNRDIHAFIKTIIDQHIETYSETYDRDFIDVYIRKMKENENTGKESSFKYDQFILNIMDFFFPPVSAVPAQLSFLIQHFLYRPDIVKKVQEEIENVVGSNRLPTLDDRQNMPYTEATLREIMRLETVVPSDVPHLAMEETTFLGYNVPKGTIMIPTIYAFHNDADIWGDPHIFRPDRFLDIKGNLSLKKDITVPFGAGKRLCAGETFARNIMFLVTTALCQNFDFVLGPGQSLPDMSKNLTGITLTTYDFWVHLESK